MLGRTYLTASEAARQMGVSRTSMSVFLRAVMPDNVSRLGITAKDGRGDWLIPEDALGELAQLLTGKGR